MTYNIFSSTAPAMPKTDKSTKFIDFTSKMPPRTCEKPWFP